MHIRVKATLNDLHGPKIDLKSNNSGLIIQEKKLKTATKKQDARQKRFLLRLPQVHIGPEDSEVTYEGQKVGIDASKAEGVNVVA